MRLVGANGEQRGIVTRDEALGEARTAGLDLVMVAADAEPPVCKVMDYGKHVFDLKKTKAAQRKKQKLTQVKEMKFRPGTEEETTKLSCAILSVFWLKEIRQRFH